MTPPVTIVISSPTSTTASPSDPGALRIGRPGETEIDVMDLGLTRGDGIFETVGISHGRVHAVDEHLRRFARSAGILDLPEPNAALFRAAVELGIRELQPGDREAYCKYVLTRGIEGTDQPTGWAYLDFNPDWTTQRTEGIAVVLLSRGYPLDVQTASPWLLQGAKTLSYAVNRSVLREAARRGADDVVFTTTDGHLLEGPTSSLVMKFGNTVVTPAMEGGVLHGTTQIDTFAFFEGLGFETVYRAVEVGELADADAAWMTNSQRLAAAITSVDGVARAADFELSARLNAFLVGRTS